MVIFIFRIIASFMQPHPSQPLNQQHSLPSPVSPNNPLTRSSLPSFEVEDFPWGERWLRGEEYGTMLDRAEEYMLRLGVRRCGLNQHPLQIYEQPENGMVYFMEGSLEAFGFPRVTTRKNYRWKKMNFTTDLPKQHPIVTYLVASSFKKGSLGIEPAEEFRMHVVVAFQTPSLLLCHIRRVLPLRQSTSSLPSPTSEGLLGCVGQHGVDFYRLFAYIHNYHWLYK